LCFGKAGGGEIESFERRRQMAQPTVATHRRVFAASTLVGEKVMNPRKEDLGRIEELMIDPYSGRVAYAVLSFGGFLGLGDKLFAIPWSALSLDAAEKRFILNISKDLLERAPGFDKANWPDMSDPAWGAQVYTYYGYKPYWG
jgi:sporulation protein YlmC with PRC-barrel domain